MSMSVHPTFQSCNMAEKVKIEIPYLQYPAILAVTSAPSGSTDTTYLRPHCLAALSQAT